jgi:hypothetical protein
VEELWTRVEEGWSDEAAHDAYLAAMTELGRLGDAAARYRGLVDDPARGPVARKRLARIVILAEQALVATQSKGDPAPLRRRVTLFAVVVCAALLGLMLWAFRVVR